MRTARAILLAALCLREGEWTDCRKNEAKCREELEKSEDGDKPDKGEGKGNGKGKKKQSAQGGAASQHPSSVRELRQLSVEALLKLPGHKEVRRMSKQEFITKYGRSMNKRSGR